MNMHENEAAEYSHFCWKVLKKKKFNQKRKKLKPEIVEELQKQNFPPTNDPQ